MDSHKTRSFGLITYIIHSWFKFVTFSIIRSSIEASLYIYLYSLQQDRQTTWVFMLDNLIVINDIWISETNDQVYICSVLSLNFPYDLELTRASHIPHSVINYFLEIRSSLVAGIGAGVGISLISFVWRVSGGGLAALEQRGLLVFSPARNIQNIKHLHISPMYPMKTTISTTLLMSDNNNIQECLVWLH